MRLYAQIEDVGTEYYCLAPLKMSLNPFKSKCYYIDIESKKSYRTSYLEGDKNFDWKPFNCKVTEWTFYDPVTKIFGDEDTKEFLDDEGYMLDRIQEGRRILEYKEGLLIKEYFKE